jgi:glycerol-3-phosphate dehydrogenase
MMIKNFGARVASVWEGLRPMTKQMLEGAMRSGTVTPTNYSSKFSYDAHADWEVSRLLSALDEQANDSAIKKDSGKLTEIGKLAETCVRVLEAQSGSAEVFIQLAERALKQHDYKKLDKLSDRLSERFSAGEIAEIVRQTEMPQIRAIAYETLALLSVPAIANLLDDPLYSDIAANALEQKAFEYESDEARDVLEQFDSESGIRSE